MIQKEISDKKLEASRKIYDAFWKAIFTHVVYTDDAAMACGMFADGVREYLYVPYSTLPADKQHDFAMQQVERMKEREMQR